VQTSGVDMAQLTLYMLLFSVRFTVLSLWRMSHWLPPPDTTHVVNTAGDLHVAVYTSSDRLLYVVGYCR